MNTIKKKKFYVLSVIGFFLLENILPIQVFANDLSGCTTNIQRVESKQLLESQDILKKKSSKESSEDTISQESKGEIEQTKNSTGEPEKSTVYESFENTEQIPKSSENTDEIANKKVEQDSNHAVKAIFSEEDWNYTDNGDKTVTLQSYKGTSKDIVVPNQIDGKQTKLDLASGLKLSGGLQSENITSLFFSNAGNKKIQVTSSSISFKGWSGLTSFDGRGLDISEVTSMANMLNGCINLTSVDVNNWDTSKVTDMNRMFADLSKIENLNLKGFNTSNVSNMAYMFWGCMALKSIDVNNWDTSNVTNMQAMFNMATSLTTVDFSNWNTGKVTNMLAMFLGCRELQNLNLSNWDTSRVVNMNSMFGSTEKLTYIDLSSFKIGDTTKTNRMFNTSNNTPLIVKVASTNNTLTKYSFMNDNRYVGGPTFDANLGTFTDGSSFKYYFDSCAVKEDDPKLDSNSGISTFNQYKSSLIPSRTGYVFYGWNLQNGQEPTEAQQLVYVRNYTATWTKGLINGEIPSPDDNEKPPIATSYGIAYTPKQFTIIESDLKDFGIQTIPISKNKSFHVAVRDQLSTENSWSLQAKLVWEDKSSIPGSSIQTTNIGEVKKNINDGSTPFQESDLIPILPGINAEVEGEKNVEITDTAKVLMKAKYQKHNSVYDYNLGNVSLKIVHAEDVKPGTYTGRVEWNLVNAP